MSKQINKRANKTSEKPTNQRPNETEKSSQQESRATSIYSKSFGSIKEALYAFRVHVHIHIYPLFVNVKRQQCLSVSKHNSKQQIFQKKNCNKNHCLPHSQCYIDYFESVCARFFSLSVLFIHFRCVFSFCNVPFPFFYIRCQIICFLSTATRDGNILRMSKRAAYCEYKYVCECMCGCVIYVNVNIFCARVSHTFPSAVCMCACVTFFLSPSISHSRMRERVNI